ncbi:MAG: hypothetical protein EOO11_04555 [Chitinophagaceae bacterium]|nr:MAG: hypothetical protein EOO11_04555 [Chitinophagaceae bacterium]
MKTTLLLTALCGACISTSAQRRLELVCEVVESTVNYGSAERYLPDSLHSIFVRPARNAHIAGPDLVTTLTLNGWKFVGATPYQETVRYGSSRATLYHLKREVLLSEEAFVEMQHKIEAALHGKR